jgi:hypothetical protein
MTAADFRRLALALPETTEAAHMGHPDFRVRGKIFATLGYPSAGWGVVKLTPKQQQRLVDSDPDTFVPAAGAWGRQGMTSIRLRDARKAIVQEALYNAWCNTAPKPLVRTAASSRR